MFVLLAGISNFLHFHVLKLYFITQKAKLASKPIRWHKSRYTAQMMSYFTRWNVYWVSYMQLKNQISKQD